MEEGAVYDYRVIARNGKKASVASQPSAPVRVKRQKPPRSEQMNKGKWTRMKKKKKKKKKEKEKEIEKEKEKEKEKDRQTNRQIYQKRLNEMTLSKD